MVNEKQTSTRRLGRGLAALMPGTTSDSTGPKDADTVKHVSPDKIRPNSLQPRASFDQDALNDLAASIAVHGVLQPIMVRKSGDGYELIAGERRFRAAQQAGVEAIPIIVRDATDVESLAIALIENIQREDLNAIEAARGYRQLLDDFDMTQSELARQIGKAQPTISNALRLLKLSPEIQDSIFLGQITEEHGKALLAVPDEDAREDLWRHVIARGLSMVETRRLALALSNGHPLPTAKTHSIPPTKDVHWAAVEDRLRSALGLRVVLKPGPDGRGSITIDFSSNEDLDSLLEKLNLLQ